MPGRPWYKHALYAPSLVNGYACWPMPGVRQAVQEDSPDEVLAARVAALVERLDAAAEGMNAAAEDMFERTSTDDAPWTIVAANYKWYARVKVVRTVVEALERAGLKRTAA